jgi:predicted RNA binding protein YcfA (HicA-like mRNA interferase family)
MPKKIRDLKGLLLRAGFICRPGKGSHTNWSHSRLSWTLTLSGNDGSDARKYHEKLVEAALDEVGEAK